jgi:hypothetical protein
MVSSNSVAPEPEGSLPYLQEPATGPYTELTGSTLHSPSQSLHSDPILPSTPWFSKWSLSFWLSHQSTTLSSPLPCVPHVLPTSDNASRKYLYYSVFTYCILNVL